MQMLEVSKLKPHPRNNEFFDDISGDNWNEFIKSVETSGIIEPIIITQEYIIVSGHQRVRAATAIGLSEVPCEVKIYDSEEQIVKDLLETNLRQRGIGNTNAIKFAKCIIELEKIYGIYKGNHQNEKLNNSTSKSQSDLADELGIDRTQLINYKKLLTLIPELQDLIENNSLSPTIGYKVLSKLSKEQQEQLISEFGKEYISKLTQRKAEELTRNIKPKIIDNTDYNTINKLKNDLSRKEKDIDFLKRDKDILERKVKLNEEDASKFNSLKQQIDELTHSRDDIKRQIEAATSISGLVVEINNVIKTKLAPVKYSKAILEAQNDKIVINNLNEIVNVVESWCNEIRTYLPNDNIIDVEVIK